MVYDAERDLSYSVQTVASVMPYPSDVPLFNLYKPTEDSISSVDIWGRAII